jgi:hypothetical protein
MPFIATGNFTVTGGVAWRRRDGTWSTKFAEAALVDEATAQVRPANEAEIASFYAIEVSDTGQPLTARERIRANGPTIHFGK